VVAEDLRGVSYLPQRVIVGVALLVAVSSLAVVGIADPDKWLDWVIQFAATLVAAALAVVGSVWLFHYQDREAEEKLQRNLVTRAAVEAQMNLWLLEGSPSKEVEPPVVTVMLSRDAFTELLRSNTVLSRDAFTELLRNNLLEPEDAMRLMDHEGAINVHNAQMEALLSALRSPGSGGMALELSADLHRRQEYLRGVFRRMVQTLRDQGYEVPTFDEAVNHPLRAEDGE
jgi:hypothetical protein